jgi:cytochrome b6-f complex iron-sulfur subunit
MSEVERDTNRPPGSRAASRSGRDEETRAQEWMTRRRFCQAAGLSACAVAAGGTAALSAEFLNPRVLFEPSTRFTVGPHEAIAVGSVLTDAEHRVFVLRLHDGFRALSSVCTHLGCVTRYQPDEKCIFCPCHGSRFALDGEVLAGPAPRPLHWLQMALSERGEIVVDTAVEVRPGTGFRP